MVKRPFIQSLIIDQNVDEPRGRWRVSRVPSLTLPMMIVHTIWYVTLL